MARSGHSRANENKALRQEQLRRYLSERGKLDYIFDNLEKIEDLKGNADKENADLDSLQIQRLKTANDTRLKLLNKYLPDLKQVEIDDSEKPDYSDLEDEELDRRIKKLQTAIAEATD